MLAQQTKLPKRPKGFRSDPAFHLLIGDTDSGQALDVVVFKVPTGCLRPAAGRIVQSDREAGELAGIVWYGLIWYGMLWYGMVLYGIALYGMVQR